jgi:hypothetical protein
MVYTGFLFRKKIEYSEISKIEYWYHAVIGFSSALIIELKNAETLTIPSSLFIHFQSILNELSVKLPGLSKVNLEQLIHENDVEDTLLIWEATRALTSR